VKFPPASDVDGATIHPRRRDGEAARDGFALLNERRVGARLEMTVVSSVPVRAGEERDKGKEGTEINMKNQFIADSLSPRSARAPEPT
jgi:hypothetical protein